MLKERINSHIHLLVSESKKHQGSIPWGEFCRLLQISPPTQRIHSNNPTPYLKEELGSELEEGKGTWDLGLISIALLYVSGINRIKILLKEAAAEQPDTMIQPALF